MGNGLRWYQKRRRVSPLSAGLLRSPGYSLSQQIIDKQLDLAFGLTLSTLSLVIPYLLYVQGIAYDSSGIGVTGAVVLGLIFLAAATGFTLVALSRLQRLRTGLEAETAIGQALETIIPNGYRVFHDIDADGFNIDHIAVGPGGVYVIETKGRRKPLIAVGGRQTKGFKVIFEKNALQFPGWRETAPLEQIRRNTKWVSNWLGQATGEPVFTTGVLALPGWYIERKSAPPPLLTNGKDIQSVINGRGRAPLPPAAISRICHQLEQRVRVRGLVTDAPADKPKR